MSSQKKFITWKFLLSLAICTLIGLFSYPIYQQIKQWSVPSHSAEWYQKNVEIGMTEAEVIKLLGEPQTREGGAWMYDNRVSDDVPDAPTRVYVLFEEGKVKLVLCKRAKQ